MTRLVLCIVAIGALHALGSAQDAGSVVFKRKTPAVGEQVVHLDIGETDTTTRTTSGGRAAPPMHVVQPHVDGDCLAGKRFADAEGRFGIGGAWPGKPYRLVVRAGDRLHAHADVRAGDGGPVVVELAAGVRRTVVQVVDLAGRPREGALVVLCRRWGNERVRDRTMFSSRGGWLATDRHGCTSSVGLSVGPCVVIVEAAPGPARDRLVRDGVHRIVVS